MAPTALDIKGALIGSSTKYRKDVLTMARMAIEDTLKYMTVRSGIQGKEVVGTLTSGAELEPYKTAKGEKNTAALRSRELETFLGSVVEEMDPYTLYETCFGESHSKTRTELEIVRAIVVEMAKVCNEYLDMAIFTGIRNPAGTTTSALFNGFDTIIKTEKTEKYEATDANYKISAANGNLQALGELTVANIGDVLTNFYRGCDTMFKRKKKVYLYLTVSLLEMYNDWYGANFNYQVNPDQERTFLHGTSKKVELVALAAMENVEHLILSTKANMLVGTDQISAKEKFEINKCDNPKVVQFFMTMYFGVNFQSIDKRELCCASFALESDVIPPTLEVRGVDNINLNTPLNTSMKDSITVKGLNLTGPLTVTIEGDGFTASVTNITAAQAHTANGKKIEITFAPTDALHTSATLNIVSVADGIDETIELIGTITV